MNRFVQKYQSLSPQEKQAFWLSTITTVISVLVGAFLVPSLSTASLLFVRIVGIMPVFTAALFLLASVLILFGRSSLGGVLYVVVNFLAVAIVPTGFKGFGFLLAVLFFIVSLYLGSLVFSKKTMRWFPYMIGFLTLVPIIIDYFWFSYRQSLPTVLNTVLQYGAFLLILIFIIISVRDFRNFSLRNKLILVSLALALIPMILVAYIANRNAQRVLTQNADDSLTLAASQAASNLDAFIDYNLDAVRTEAQYPEMAVLLELEPQNRAGSNAEVNVFSTLSTLARRSPVFLNSYGLLDRNGLVVADTDPGEMNKDMSSRSYFIEAVNSGLPYVSDIDYSELSQTPSMYFSAPVRNNLGDIIGVLRARYNAGAIQQLLTQQSNFKYGDFFGLVVTQNNLMVANNDYPEEIYKSIVPLTKAQLQELQANRQMPDIMTVEQSYIDIPDLAAGLRNIAAAPNFSGEFHAPSGEEAHEVGASLERAGIAQMKNLPWYVVVGESEDKLLAPVQVQTRGTLVIGVLAAVAAVLFALLIALFLTAPITRLAEVANRLASGDLSARSTSLTKDEVGSLAATFNTMAEQLSSMVSSLEQRVADRTRALSTSAEVSRRLSTILNLNQLVEEVVEQIQLSFNYYHVHIYLFDESKQNLVMVGGSGEAGQVMLARGHSIPRGKGLVGRAAETLSPVLVTDVTQAPGWLPNPLLPDTKSELAVPIAVSDNVMGVLDVQQNRVGGLQPEDADLLQSIANQIAVALQNSRSYADAQRRASREALIGAISQRILSTSSPEEALQVAAREIGRALGTDGVYVKLGGRKNGQS